MRSPPEKSENEEAHSRFQSPVLTCKTQEENEEKFEKIHDKISTLKAIIVTLKDGNVFFAEPSDMVRRVNRTHRSGNRHQCRSQNDSNEDDDISTIEDALLSEFRIYMAITDVELKTPPDTQTLIPNFGGSKDK